MKLHSAILLFSICVWTVYGETLIADSFDPRIEGPGLTRVFFATQLDGKIVLGGEQTRSVQGQPRNCLSRINVDGTFDSSFTIDTGNFADIIEGLETQADGKIIVFGLFSELGEEQRKGIGRLNTDGSLDSAFDPMSDNGWIRKVVIQSDGKILVGGSFGQIGGLDRAGIARLNEDGTVDQTFISDPSLGTGAVPLIVQPDGKIIVIKAGTRVFRLNSDGTLDSAFPIIQSNFVLYDIERQADNKLIVGGNFSSILGIDQNDLARFDSHGSFDNTYGPFGNVPPSWSESVQDLELLADGTLLVAGNFAGRSGLRLIDQNGAVANGALADVNRVQVVSTDSSGRILISGEFTHVGGVARRTVARLTKAVSAWGKVAASDGRGVRGATVLFTNRNNEKIGARTNTFGYYRVPEKLAQGDLYTVEVFSRREIFSQQQFVAIDNTTRIDFEERKKESLANGLFARR